MEDDYEYCEHEDTEELWEYKEIDKKRKICKIWQRTCLKCGEVEEEVLIVEYWPDKFITIHGKQYRALKLWGNISVCSECGEVVWHPLILWDSKDTSKAVTFHFRCAEQLGILDDIVQAAKRT
jgi:hypothetical protein